MQEAIAWIKSISDYDGQEALVEGRFQFEHTDIKVHFLSRLIRNDRVVILEMFRAEISSSGLVALFDAAMQSGVFETLLLDSIDFDETAINALATLMKRSKSITNYQLLSLVPENGIAVICDALNDNNVVKDLSLASNGIGLEGTRIIGRFLKANKLKALTTLDLGANYFGNDGAIALVDGLRSNESPLMLSLNYCGISDDGAIALASLLAHDSHLKGLSLQGDEIEEAGMLALANALKFNRNLRSLTLEHNPGVNGEGVKDAYIEALASNVTLLELRGINSSMIDDLVLRNNELIPKAVRRAALLLIGIRQSIDIEGMGDFAIFPKDIVRLIAQTVYATRRDPMWIQALK